MVVVVIELLLLLLGLGACCKDAIVVNGGIGVVAVDHDVVVAV